MFTGIIETLGTIKSLNKKGEDIVLRVLSKDLDMEDVKIGDSIAVNGVCLTAIELFEDGFSADVSNETIRHTSFKFLEVGSRVNLEKALTPSTRLGGHLVSGHVDGLGEVVESFDDGRAIRFVIKAPDDIAKYIAAKGSVCVDGISLTVNEVNGSLFYLNIVPHTAEVTSANAWKSGVEVNLEVDIIARYLERLLTGNKPDASTEISESFLAEHGFIK